MNGRAWSNSWWRQWSLLFAAAASAAPMGPVSNLWLLLGVVLKYVILRWRLCESHFEFVATRMLSSRREKALQLAQDLPKVELHLHLDGSLSPEFLARQSLAQGIPLPVADSADLRTWIVKQKMESVAKNKSNPAGASGNWSVFDFCNQFLQTELALEEAVADLLRRLCAWNVVYAEIRFCPALHVLGGLTPDQVMLAVIRGFNSQKEVQGGLIVCCLRSKSREHAVQMAELASKYLQRETAGPPGVVGFDVAGDEGSFPLNGDDCPMADGVKIARARGVPVTVHAGEWPKDRYDTLGNVLYALHHLGAARIGHGLALKLDPDAMRLVKSKGVTVEVCLTSNVAMGLKVPSFADHPARDFFHAGVPFALSCDNLLISGDLENHPEPGLELVHLVEDVFGPGQLDNDEGWKAVRFALVSAMGATFSPSVDERRRKLYLDQVDEVFGRHGIRPSFNIGRGDCCN